MDHPVAATDAPAAVEQHELEQADAEDTREHELEQAERDEIEAWLVARAVANAETDAKAWQRERDERRIAELDAAEARAREREELDELEAWRETERERQIAKHDAAEARARERASRRFRRNFKRGVALWRRTRANRAANRRIVATPPTRRRGAGRPGARSTSTSSTDSDPDPAEHALAPGGAA